ncbi:MAG TPA: fibronectin type III domain-containing protein [Acidimicrobiia bacterium]|jgi:prepilin-type N-terminal cleavage/methylation domain-containing protein|nr:fibronectin type III domain-containing protein [Acidimicrobiia bacterium]
MDALDARDSRRNRSEAGFTIIELVVSMALLAIVAAPLAGVFWSSIRTAGVSGHRTDGSSIASREIEAMRAVPYAQVGFYANQAGFVSTFDSPALTTVSLGPSAPASVALAPTDAAPVVQGGVPFTVARYIVWIDARDSTTTFAQAYKRLTVIITWTDRGGAHQVRQDSLLYPGGRGTYQGPMGGVAPSTTTTIAASPSSPNLQAITPLASPSDQTQVGLSWSQPGAGASVTSYSIEFSTNASFPAGNFTVISGLAPSITNYIVTNLTPSTTYFFEIVAYAGSYSSVSQSQSQTTAAVAGPTCSLGGLNVAGATSLSTTGTKLQNNGKMSENLTLSWSTAGSCSDSYQVTAVDPNSAADPGSPYVLGGSSGAYSAIVGSSGSKSWAVGLHTFRVFDINTNSATSVVKTFKVCVNGAASC